MGNTKQELRIDVEKFIKDTIGIVSPRNVCWSKLDLNSTENKIRIEIIVTVNDPLDTKSINFSEQTVPLPLLHRGLTSPLHCLLTLLLPILKHILQKTVWFTCHIFLYDLGVL